LIPVLDDEHHERLWRICDTLVSGAGARAALLCDESNGSILVSVGDATASGAVSGLKTLGPREVAMTGSGGEIYGVNVPGGAILVVLHDAAVRDQVRASAAKAVQNAADLIAHLPPPPPPPVWPPAPHDAHGHAVKAGSRLQAPGSRPKAKAKAKKKPVAKPEKKRRLVTKTRRPKKRR